MTQRIILGIGNPGPKYAGTRHNIGFEVIDALAHEYALSFFEERFRSDWTEVKTEQGTVVLLKPRTYVNNSGSAVVEVLDFYDVPMENLLVIADDLHLPLGKIRLRAKGSSGGHNGLRSIINLCGTNEFARLRIGIGCDAIRDVTEYVLGQYDESEKAEIFSGVRTAVAAVHTWLEYGIDRTMNIFN